MHFGPEQQRGVQLDREVDVRRPELYQPDAVARFFVSVGILFYIATIHAVLVQPSAGQSPRGFAQVFGVSR